MTIADNIFSDVVALLVIAGLLILFFLGGWLYAHNEVATECVRQGGFYVGDKDYVCKLKDKV